MIEYFSGSKVFLTSSFPTVMNFRLRHGGRGQAHAMPKRIFRQCTPKLCANMRHTRQIERVAIGEHFIQRTKKVRQRAVFLRFTSFRSGNVRRHAACKLLGDSFKFPVGIAPSFLELALSLTAGWGPGTNGSAVRRVQFDQ